MATYPRVLVSGVDMSDPQGRWGLDPTQPLRVGPGRRATSVPVPGRSGVLWPRSESRDVGTHSIVLIVAGDPAAKTRDARTNSIEQALDALMFLFDQPSYQLDVYTSATDVKRAEGRTLSSSVEKVGSDAARITFVIEVPDAFWHSIVEYETIQRNTAGTAQSSVTFDVLTGGTAPIVDAKMLITGPFTAWNIFDVRSGQSLMYRQSLLNGQWMSINCLSFTSRTVGSGTPDYDTTAGTDVSPNLIAQGPNSDTSWLTLQPGMAGGGTDPMQRSYTIKFDWAGGNANTSIRFKARKAYL